MTESAAPEAVPGDDPAELAPDELLAAWYEYLDARFPLGAWVEELYSDRDPYLLPVIGVLRLYNSHPVLFGYDYLTDQDVTMYVETWSEGERNGSYVAKAHLADPDRRVEFRSRVPPIMRTAEAQATREAQRAHMEAMARASGEARLHELLGGGTVSEAEQKAAAATDDVIAASMVYVRPHVRHTIYGIVNVDGYWYDRETGMRLPTPIAKARQGRAAKPAALRRPSELRRERVRGLTRSATRPGVATGYTRPAKGNGAEPMDDATAAAREKRAHELLSEAIKGGFATDSMYVTRDSYGNAQWAPERAFQHEQIVAAFMARSASVPRDRKGLVAGGLPGAGKTTTLDKVSEIKRTDYMALNPDDIKEEMARRGMIPFVDGLTPMEASPLVHQEAGHIVDAIAAAALAEGRNVMWDVTLANRQTADWILNSMRNARYDQIDAVFVRTSAENARTRVMSRWRNLADAWNAGDPNSNGGRLVPEEVVNRQRRADGTLANEYVFNEVTGQFLNWWRFDNNEDEPVLVDSGGAAKAASTQSPGGDE